MFIREGEKLDLEREALQKVMHEKGRPSASLENYGGASAPPAFHSAGKCSQVPCSPCCS